MPTAYLGTSAPWRGADSAHLVRTGCSSIFLTPAKLDAFVAVAEEGGFSAAARRLHISQPALSQTVNAIERQSGLKLLERSSIGVRATHPGLALLTEARAILARHDQLLQTMTAYTADGEGLVRLGMPFEIDPDVLRELAQFADGHPLTRLVPHHLSTSAQLAAVCSGQLDVGLVYERPSGPEFDTMLAAQENLGIVLATELTARLSGPDGIRLNTLAGLEWVSFPRSDGPAWYDEVAAILRSHGVDVSAAADDDQFPFASATIAAVSGGRAFALAPQHWANPIPDALAWSLLAGHPLVRRTWAVWPACTHRRDVANSSQACKSPNSGQRKALSTPTTATATTQSF